MQPDRHVANTLRALAVAHDPLAVASLLASLAVLAWFAWSLWSPARLRRSP